MSVEQWFPLINKYAKKYGIDPQLGAVLIQQESSGDPYAVSSVGARGLMQILPQYHALHGENLFDPETNLDIGFRILSDNLKQYGNIFTALRAYYGGSGGLGLQETADYANALLGRVKEGRFVDILRQTVVPAESSVQSQTPPISTSPVSTMVNKVKDYSNHFLSATVKQYTSPWEMFDDVYGKITGKPVHIDNYVSSSKSLPVGTKLRQGDIAFWEDENGKKLTGLIAKINNGLPVVLFPDEKGKGSLITPTNEHIRKIVFRRITSR